MSQGSTKVSGQSLNMTDQISAAADAAKSTDMRTRSSINSPEELSPIDAEKLHL